MAAISALSSSAVNGTGKGGHLIMVNCATQQGTSIPWLSIGLEYAAIIAISFVTISTGTFPIFAAVMAAGGGVALVTGC